MKQWIIIVTLIIVGVISLLLLTKHQANEGFGVFKDVSNEFTESQRSLFGEKLDKAILVNPGLNTVGINDVFKQPDFYLPTSPDRDYSNYFMEDNNAFEKRDFEVCRNVVHPKNIQRQPKATLGCGWWFVEDPSKPSVAALGRYSEPLDKKLGEDYPGGRWIWNLQDAMKLEDIKKCKRVKLCAAINAQGVNGECAFCPELGYAVPIDKSGNLKYPDDKFGGCDDLLVRTADMCPIPTITSTTSGPSDGSDYIYDENGSLISKGDTSTANAGIAKTLCTPDRHGKLTGDCLKALAISVGVYEKSNLIHLINRTKIAPDQTDAIAIKYIKERGRIPIPDGVLGSGSVDVDTASSTYSRIVQLTMTGTSNMVREAAKYMVSDKNNFDICEFDKNEMGPFPVECMEREFRKAGCQPSGKASPNEQNRGRYADLSWGELGGEFRKLYLRMNSSKVKQQDPAVLDCLGTEVFRKKPEVCDEPGIEYLVFDRTNDGTEGTYLGRVISKTGLLKASEGAWAQPTALEYLLKNGGTRGAIYRARTFVTVPTKMDLESGRPNHGFWHPMGSYTFKVNDVTIPRDRKFETWSGWDRSIWNLPIAAKLRNKIEIIFNSSGTATGNPNFAYINDNLPKFQLGQDSWRPVIAMDFFKGSIQDHNGVVALQRPGVTSSTIDNRQCALIDGQDGSYIKIKNDIMSSTVKAITIMVNVQDFASNTNPYLFKFTGENGEELSTQVLNNGRNLAVTFASSVSNKAYTVIDLSYVAASGILNKWIHVAVAIDDDNQGFRTYINGKAFDNKRATSPIQNVKYTSEMICPRLNAGVAWFHIYDTVQSYEDIDYDMNYDVADYEKKEADDNLSKSDPQYDLEFGYYYNGRPLTTLQNVPSPIECGNKCRNDPRCGGFTHDKRWNGGLCMMFKNYVDKGKDTSNSGDTYVAATVFNDRDQSGQGKCPKGMFEYGTHHGGFCCPVQPTNTYHYPDFNNCEVKTLNGKTLCALNKNSAGGNPVCPTA